MPVLDNITNCCSWRRLDFQLQREEKTSTWMIMLSNASETKPTPAHKRKPIFPQQPGLKKHFSVSVFRRPLKSNCTQINCRPLIQFFAFKRTVRDSSGSGAHKLCIYNIKTKVQWKKGNEYPKNIQWRHFRVQLLQMPQQELWVGLEFQKLCHSRIMLIFKKPHDLCWMSL